MPTLRSRLRAAETKLFQARSNLHHAHRLANTLNKGIEWTNPIRAAIHHTSEAIDAMKTIKALIKWQPEHTP